MGIDISKMTTKAELMQLAKLELDKRYYEKYPMGKFMYHDYCFNKKESAYKEMIWEPFRSTSHVSKRAVVVQWSDGSFARGGPAKAPHILNHRNNSFGITKTFNAPEPFVQYCLGIGVPMDTVQMWMKEYIANLHLLQKRRKYENTDVQTGE